MVEDEEERNRSQSVPHGWYESVREREVGDWKEEKRRGIGGVEEVEVWDVWWCCWYVVVVEASW